MKRKEVLAALLGGILFGFGLAWSTMVSPESVLRFLRLQDFGLMLVMGGGVMVTLLAYRLVPRWLKRPLWSGRFGVHASVWNRDTLVGAAIFGVGWGLCGVCPGPAIAGLGAGNWLMLVALVGAAAGAYVQGLTAAPGGSPTALTNAAAED